MDSKELVERLEQHPKLKAGLEALLKIAENQDGKIELADDAEEMIITAGREFNHNMLELWAERQISTKAGEFEKRHKNAHKDIKKNSNGIHGLEQ
jgi:hypothetical protein